MKSKQPSQSLKSEILKLVEKYQEILGLSNWRIEIFFKPIGDNRAGECHPLNAFKMAKISFDLSKKEWEDPVFREIGVIHELLHCSTSGWALEIEETIANYVGEELQDEVRLRCNRAEERELTELAWAFYKNDKKRERNN